MSAVPGNELPPDLPGEDDHLIERQISSKPVYTGHFLEVRRDVVSLPDGREAAREYIVHPGAVVVLPLLDDGRLVVERQYRYPLARVMLEFPAGKLEAGEEPLVCGIRELAEETGYRAREWARAGVMHNAIAYSDEAIEIWLARGLHPGERNLDAGEFLDVELATLEDLLERAASGEITDAKTLVALLWLQNLRNGHWSVNWQTLP